LEFFLQYKKVILRSLGILMLIVGFAVFFWKTPQEGLSENELAAANVARLEARVAGSSASTQKAQPDTSKILQKFKETREDQVKYFMILVMIAGTLFVLYSFLKKEPNE